MKSMQATRLGAADIADFEAVVINDNDNDQDEPIMDEVIFIITEDTDEATIIDLLYKLKTIGKVLLSHFSCSIELFICTAIVRILTLHS